MLAPWQMFLECEGHEYPDHDSYLGCAQPYEEDLEGIKRMLMGDPNIYLDQMSKRDFLREKKLIVSADSILKN